MFKRIFARRRVFVSLVGCVDTELNIYNTVFGKLAGKYCVFFVSRRISNFPVFVIYASRRSILKVTNEYFYSVVDKVKFAVFVIELNFNGRISTSVCSGASNRFCDLPTDFVLLCNDFFRSYSSVGISVNTT